MSIHTLAQKIKTRIGERKKMFIFAGILIFTAFSSFYVGYIAHVETTIVTPKASNFTQAQPIDTKGDIPQIASNTTVKATDGAYVASKNGTKYYSKTCSGAKRIKDTNSKGSRYPEKR